MNRYRADFSATRWSTLSSRLLKSTHLANLYVESDRNNSSYLDTGIISVYANRPSSNLRAGKLVVRGTCLQGGM